MRLVTYPVPVAISAMASEVEYSMEWKWKRSYLILLSYQIRSDHLRSRENCNSHAIAHVLAKSTKTSQTKDTKASLPPFLFSLVFLIFCFLVVAVEVSTFSYNSRASFCVVPSSHTHPRDEKREDDEGLEVSTETHCASARLTNGFLGVVLLQLLLNHQFSCFMIFISLELLLNCLLLCDDPSELFPSLQSISFSHLCPHPLCATFGCSRMSKWR